MAKKERLKVTFKLKLPFVICDQRTTFDGILAGVKSRDLISKGMAPEEAIKDSCENLPIEKFYYGNGKKQFLYRASCPILDIYLPNYTKVFKKITYMRAVSSMEIADLEKVIKILDKQSGPWKVGMANINNISFTRDISFIAVVPKSNRDDFEALVGKTKYIGKKSSLGFGIVSEFNIEKTDEKIKRHIPISIGVFNYPVFLTRTIPPYWQRKGRELCGMTYM